MTPIAITALLQQAKDASTLTKVRIVLPDTTLENCRVLDVDGSYAYVHLPSGERRRVHIPNVASAALV